MTTAEEPIIWTCNHCKQPKSPHLFGPSQRRRKSKICRKCDSAKNKDRKMRNPVPADHPFCMGPRDRNDHEPRRDS